MSIGAQKGPISAYKKAQVERLVPVVHRGDPRAAECPTRGRPSGRAGGSCGPTGASRDAPRIGSGAVLETPAFVSRLDNVAVMRQSIEKRGGHLGIAKNARPFTKGEIGCHDY